MSWLSRFLCMEKAAASGVLAAWQQDTIYRNISPPLFGARKAPSLLISHIKQAETHRLLKACLIYESKSHNPISSAQSWDIILFSGIALGAMTTGQQDTGDVLIWSWPRDREMRATFECQSQMSGPGQLPWTESCKRCLINCCKWFEFAMLIMLWYFFHPSINLGFLLSLIC